MIAAQQGSLTVGWPIFSPFARTKVNLGMPKFYAVSMTFSKCCAVKITLAI